LHEFVLKSCTQRAALENIKKVLKAAGTTLEGIVKANIFITNFEDFEALNEIYQEVRAERIDGYINLNSMYSTSTQGLCQRGRACR